MKKVIDTKREKLKWLSALCLCLLCFSLCLSMLAGPTLAAVALDPLTGLQRIDASKWGDGTCGGNKDSFGDTQANSCMVGGAFDGPGLIGWARYKLDKGYVKFSGTLACADASTNHAAMRLKVYADDKADAIYTSGPILRGTRPFTFEVDVKNVTVLKMELAQMDVDYVTPPQGSPLGFVLLVNPLLETVTTPPPGEPEPAPVPLKDIPTPETMNWPSAYADNKDSRGTAHANSGLIGGRFQLAHNIVGQAFFQLDKKYGKLIASLACGEGSDAKAEMNLKIFGDGMKPLYTSPAIKQDTAPFEFSVDVSGVSVLYMVLQYPSGKEPVNGEEIDGLALLINPLLELAPPTPPEPSSSATAPTSSTIYRRYEPVYGWTGLYLLLESTAPLPTLTTTHALVPNPAHTYVYSFSRNPGTDRVPVYVKGEKVYFELLKNDVYVALTKGGVYDISDAVWAGADRVFGSPDDKPAIMKAFEPSNSLFYEESPGVWKFLVHCRDFVDSRWNNIFIDPPAPTTTVPTSNSTGSIVTTTTSPFLTTKDPDGPPKTGAPFNVGLLVCVAALFMGCLYCGYRLVRKEKA